jgi:hypothetical protein
MRSKPTYANVTSTLALFIALGGTSYAAVSIGSANVRNNSLTGVDVRNNSLTGADVRNGSLLAGDFKAGQLPAGTKGDTGAPGLRGVNGDTGAAGAGSASKGAFVQGNFAPLTLEPGADWVTLASLQTTTVREGVFTFAGAVEEASTSKSATGRVELRILHNGHEHPVPSDNSIAPDQSEVGHVLMFCDEAPGTHDAQLQGRATGSGILIGDRNLVLAETVHLP